MAEIHCEHGEICRAVVGPRPPRWSVRGPSDQKPDSAARSKPDLLVSSASAWEISIKKAIGKLSAPDDLGEQISANGFEELPILVDHALLAGALPRRHDDPFDGMLLAQAARESLTIVTRDERFGAYNLTIIAA